MAIKSRHSSVNGQSLFFHLEVTEFDVAEFGLELYLLFTTRGGVARTAGTLGGLGMGVSFKEVTRTAGESSRTLGLGNRSSNHVLR